MANKSARPFQNGVKPGHAIILLVFLLIRYCYGGPSSDGHDTHGGNGSHDGPELHAEAEEGEGGHSDHGYQVFHMEFDRVELPFIIALWIFVSSLAKIGFHMTPKVSHIFPESCLLIVVGIIIGFLLFWTSEHEPPSTLTPDVFFLFMLPPIILDAGYFMPNRLFFDHLGTILLMAVVGTIFNAMTIGAALYSCGLTGIFGEDPPGILETFLFSSLISAVDPVAVLAVFEEIHVDEILYIVVFGESLLNDAVTVVLYHMFEAYVDIGVDNIQVNDVLKGFASFLVVALGGTVVGIIWGFVTGFVTRFTNHARILEPLFVFTMAYLSYLTAEIFHLSGIMAITFCGITMKNYVERNISSKSQTTLKYAMKMLSGSSETIIFMFLGVATIHDSHDWNWAFVTLTILFCTVFRIIGVIVLTALANNYRLHKLKTVDQFVMMYGGLRGAVAFALVLLVDKKKVPHADMFITTTIAMVYWTVFVQGITIKPLVKFLNVKVSSEKDPTMNERIAGRFMDHVVAGMEGILGELGNLRIRDMYKRLDDKYIKPCLLRDNHYKDPKIIETYENLAEREALEFMRKNPTQFAELAGSKTMAELNAMAGPGSNGDLLRGAPSDAAMDPGNAMDNRDLKERHYTQSQKDLTETRIHHMLSENLFMPRNRPRKLSYSRHAVTEDQVSQGHDINYKMHMQVRRMLSDNRNLRRRKHHRGHARDHEQVHGVPGAEKKLKDDIVMREIEKTDRSVRYTIDEENSTDEDDFITIKEHKPPKKKGNGVRMPPVDDGDNSPVPWLMSKGQDNRAYVVDSDDNDVVDGRKIRKASREPIQAAQLPWRRDASNDCFVDDSREECGEAAKPQGEFPGWIKNKEYTRFESPRASIVGGTIDLPPSISALRRGSSGSIGLPMSGSDVGAGGSTSGGSRKNSELEMEHSANFNEAEFEARRQRMSIARLNQRRNTSTSITIPEAAEAEDSEDNNTKL